MLIIQVALFLNRKYCDNLTSQVRKPKISGEVRQTLILCEGGVWERDYQQVDAKDRLQLNSCYVIM